MVGEGVHGEANENQQQHQPAGGKQTQVEVEEDERPEGIDRKLCGI